MVSQLRRSPQSASMLGTLHHAAMVLASALLVTGCSSAKVLNPSPNDALRAENMELREKLDRAALQNKELLTRLAERRKETDGASTRPVGGRALDPEAEAAIPRIATVHIEGATDVIRRTPGAPPTLRLWVLPRDGRGRFLQVVGTLSVGVTVLRAGEPPVEISQASFGPAAVRDAWRSGLMGSHYAFEMPLTIPSDLAAAPLTITIRFDDALSNRSFEDERRIAATRDAIATLSGSGP